MLKTKPTQPPTTPKWTPTDEEIYASWRRLPWQARLAIVYTVWRSRFAPPSNAMRFGFVQAALTLLHLLILMDSTSSTLLLIIAIWCSSTVLSIALYPYIKT